MYFHSGVRTPRDACQVASLNMTASRWVVVSPRISGCNDRPSIPSASGRPRVSRMVGKMSVRVTMAFGADTGIFPGAHMISGTWVTES